MHPRLLSALLLGLTAIGCRGGPSDLRTDSASISPQYARASSTSGRDKAPRPGVTAVPETPRISLWKTRTFALPDAGPADAGSLTWTALYSVGGARKVGNIDVSAITNGLTPKTIGSTSCTWSLAEWFDGPITRPRASELVLLLEPRCDGSSEAQQRRLLVTASSLQTHA